MGLFGGKKRNDDDDDLPTGSSDVIPPARLKPPPPPPPESSDLPHRVGAATKPPEVKNMSAPPVSPQPMFSGATVAQTFGIDEAVQLVRQLPTRNTELVMQVMKKTLESLKVDVSQIIDGGTKKEHALEDRITSLRKEIEKQEGLIAAAKKEIAQLEADQREVTSVKERLIQAQKAESDSTSDRPLGALGATATAKPAMSVPPPMGKMEKPVEKAEKPVEKAEKSVEKAEKVEAPHPPPTPPAMPPTPAKS